MSDWMNRVGGAIPPHPCDEGLPHGLRRCKDADCPSGGKPLPLSAFHKHPTSRKGRMYICKGCYTRMRRRMRAAKRAALQADAPPFPEYFQVTHCPQELFEGLFRKHDFLMSLLGSEDGTAIWADGTRVVDEQGQRYEVANHPPRLLGKSIILMVGGVTEPTIKKVPILSGGDK